MKKLEMFDNDWHTKRLINFTIEDAMAAFKEGFVCICADGHPACLTNDPDMI
jgi:hypothetical protein